MHQLKGSIDFSRLHAPLPLQLPISQQDGWNHLEFSGISLTWRTDCAQLAADDQFLVLSVGRPRMCDASPLESTARNWLTRFRELGASAARDVGGAFAVIMIDVQQRKSLLFCDRYAIETLCYKHSAAVLTFSDAAAIVPGSSGEIDPQAIYDYLYFHVIPAPATIFHDVKRIDAGELLTADARVAAISRYWQPQFVEYDCHNLKDRLEQFRDIVRASIEEEADDEQVACFLSGGTDSSTIAGMLAQLRGKPVPAYSIGFEAEGYDEMAYARIAARHFGLDHREYYVTPNDLVEAIPRVASSTDQPFGNSSILPAYYCALRAKEDGHTRMLAGDGGDELFGGNARYASQKIFEYYQVVPRALRHLIEPPAMNWKLFRQVPGFRQFGGYVRHSRIPMPDRMESFNLLHALDQECMLLPDFGTRIRREHPLELQRNTWHDIRAHSLLNRMLAYDWKYTLADSDLPKVRTATQLAGVSVGYPFLSLALTDFSLSIPPQWKLKGYRLRWFFKEALRNFLPNEILRKEKHGFGLPFGTWALQHSGLRELAEDSLHGLGGRGIFNEKFLIELMGTHLPKAPTYYGEMVWILMMLEQWLRSHTASPGSPVRSRQ
jgi:asparagine synthase (glutamine-hydrolysing)